MIQNLVRPPKVDQDWKAFSFSHKISHDKMADAVRANTGVHLPSYNLHPLVADDWNAWLNRNQQAHYDIFTAIGRGAPPIQNVNLGVVNLNDREDFQRWTMNHWMQHKDLELFLGIGS